MQRQQSGLLEARKWVRQWWWVAILCLGAGTFFSQAMKLRRQAVDELSFRLCEMDKEMLLAAQELEELNLQLASQSDPAWVELVLLRQMGVVPEGFLKVHFSLPEPHGVDSSMQRAALDRSL